MDIIYQEELYDHVANIMLTFPLIDIRLTDLDVDQLLVLPHAGRDFGCF